MNIGTVEVGGGAPLVLISGLNVIESESATLDAATALCELAARHGIPLVFKASFDKANRSSVRSFRGPGLDEGLRTLARVKSELAVPVTTDVHDAAQAKPAAEVVDCLQIPAFLCRQTDLVAACASTGRPLNIKKAQFLAPDDLRLALEKARHFGAEGVMVTERGTAFGYHDLIVDFRGFAESRRRVPLCFDATHAAQRPGAGNDASGGNRDDVAPLARAAVAVGVDALFVEVHPDPESAPCDGPSQIDFASLDRLLGEVVALSAALAGRA